MQSMNMCLVELEVLDWVMGTLMWCMDYCVNKYALLMSFNCYDSVQLTAYSVIDSSSTICGVLFVAI